MKKLLIALLGVLFVAGCTQTAQDCNSYCEARPHVQCVGSWNITGSYPNCTCEFKCSTSNIGSLGNFSDLSVNGMNELGDLPSVNSNVNIGGGILSSNPFPSEPSLQ